MLIDSHSFDARSHEFSHDEDDRWQLYVALKGFFGDFVLPRELDAVYAHFSADNDVNPIVELKVVDQFPDHLAKSAYRMVYDALGENHPMLEFIKNPEQEA